MLYYLLAIALIANFIFFIVVQKLKNHDRVLYRFCELRRRMMRILRDDNRLASLSRQEYVVLRKLLDMVNQTIAAYRDHKTIMFNLRIMVYYLKEYKRYNRRAELIPKTKCTEIEDIRSGIKSALLLGFLTYTPFLKHELFVIFVIFVFKILVNAGANRVSGYLSTLSEARELTRAAPAMV